MDALGCGDWKEAGGGLWNRLQPAAETLSPWIERLRREFSELDCLGHGMSGSGTAYFGLCRHGRHARRVARRLRAGDSTRYLRCKAASKKRIGQKERGQPLLQRILYAVPANWDCRLSTRITSFFNGRYRKETNRGNHRGSHQAYGGVGRAAASVLLGHVRRRFRGSRSENHRRHYGTICGHAQSQAYGPLPAMRLQEPSAGGLLQPVRLAAERASRRSATTTAGRSFTPTSRTR